MVLKFYEFVLYTIGNLLYGCMYTLYMNLNEAVLEVRKNYCEPCREQFTMDELDNGSKCEICKQCEELGQTVANLQD